MAMLQRRFASSVYAVRRSLERMRDKRQKILADPEKYRKEQIEDRLPEEFDDLPEDEQMEIEARLEGMVVSADSVALREEIQRFGRLIEHARVLEGREIESKLVKLRTVLSDNNVFNDPKMKLLIFTEHKDTLDYLAGDGKDGPSRTAWVSNRGERIERSLVAGRGANAIAFSERRGRDADRPRQGKEEERPALAGIPG
jgi:hypothetical protein